MHVSSQEGHAEIAQSSIKNALIFGWPALHLRVLLVDLGEGGDRELNAVCLAVRRRKTQSFPCDTNVRWWHKGYACLLFSTAAAAAVVAGFHLYTHSHVPVEISIHFATEWRVWLGQIFKRSVSIPRLGALATTAHQSASNAAMIAIDLINGST